MKASGSTLRRIEAIVALGRARRLASHVQAAAQFAAARGSAGSRGKTRHRRER